MAEQTGDKKHEASDFRREKAREEGNVAKSQDLGSAFLLLVGVVSLDFFGPPAFQSLTTLLRSQLSESWYLEADSRTPLINFVRLLGQASIAVVPLMLLVFVAALIVNFGQIGFLWLPDKLGFDFSRIDPMQGFSRLFSIQSASRLGFGLLKIGIVTTVLIVGLWGDGTN